MRNLTTEQRDFARTLRANATDAERVLWRALRGKQMWARFRRQHALGPYVLDFACVAQRLVVEVDGGQHNGSARDAVRDAWLSSRGWRVLRFWNNDVMSNMDGVLRVICDALAALPPSQPSPLPGEGANAPSPGKGEGWGGGPR
jgi:very-short-patch-repair endonuclease